MTKEFERKVIREGCVDTRKYRYVYESSKDMEDLLFVDDAGAVFDADENYVANCIEADPGDGICC